MFAVGVVSYMVVTNGADGVFFFLESKRAAFDARNLFFTRRAEGYEYQKQW